MHRLEVPCTLLLFAGIASSLQGQPTLRRDSSPLIEALSSESWPRVDCARFNLVETGKPAIPLLLELLDNDRRRPLRDTLDLSYPGHPNLHGHGYYIDYALDCVGVRAGWALESLLFQDFGYRELSNLSELKSPGATEERRGTELLGRLRASAQRARTWWSVHSKSWDRLDALLQAVESPDPTRQTSALDWLAAGDTQIPGFSDSTYASRVRPVLVRLAASGHRCQAVAAGLLKLDKEYHYIGEESRRRMQIRCRERSP